MMPALTTPTPTPTLAVDREARRVPLQGLNGEELASGYARTRRLEYRDRAIQEHRKLVEILAAKMARKGAPVEDLVQVGLIGLIQALERFDPGRGVKFRTYAVNTIVGEIKHYYRDCTWMIKVPRQLQEVAASVHRLREQHSREHGQAPTISELGATLGVSEELIVEAMELDLVYAPYSLDAQLGKGDSEQHDRLTELLGGSDRRIDSVVAHAPLWSAINDLEPRKRWILRRRYFDEWSQSEVGQALGISQMHVSRLEREALRELRTSCDA